MPDRYQGDFWNEWYYTDPLRIREEEVDEFGVGDLYRQLPNEVEKLTPYLQDQSEFVRQVALQKLFHRGTEEEISNIISPLLGNTRYPELDSLLYLLSYGYFKNVQLISELVVTHAGAWIASNDPHIIRAAIPLIIKYSEHKHIRLLIPFLDSDEPLLHWQAYDSLKYALLNEKLNIQKLSQQERGILLKHFPELIPTEHPFEGWPSMAWRGMTLYIADTMPRKSKGLQSVKQEKFENQAILFPYINAIHSQNCLFDFVVLYLSDTGEVLERKTVAPNQNFVQGPQGSVHVLEMNVGAAPDLVKGQMLSELAGFFGEEKLAVRVAQVPISDYQWYEHAIHKDNLLLIDRYLAQGMDINSRNGLGWTPLHVAAWSGSVSMTRYLVEHGADVNARNKEGMTPFYWTVQHGPLEQVIFFIENGADIHIKDKHGETALDWRIEHYSESDPIAQYLKLRMRIVPDKEWRTSNKEAIRTPDGGNTERFPGGGRKDTHPDGTIKYYDKDDMVHREDGPAAIYPDGRKYYFQHGKFHRTDGPAVIRPDGTEEYHINGKQFSKQEFQQVQRDREIRTSNKDLQIVWS